MLLLLKVYYIDLNVYEVDGIANNAKNQYDYVKTG